MDKFISAESMKKGLEELGRSPWANGTELCPWNIAIKDALGTVKDLCIEKEPAADVAPVRHGEWLNAHHTAIVQCSLCGGMVATNWRGFYCQNCGAKMDGG